MSVEKMPCLLAKYLLAFIVAGLFLAGCEDPRLEHLPSNARILAFGDSLTEGYGVGKEDNYPNILSEITGFTVVNAGVSGEVTAQGARRFSEVLGSNDADLVILLEGGNDILRNHDAADTKRNLALMIEMAQVRDIPVILIGVPEKKFFSDAAPFYGELAEEYHLVYEDEIIASLLRSPDLKSDSVHFNEKGYRALAVRIKKLLSESGAL